MSNIFTKNELLRATFFLCVLASFAEETGNESQ